MDGFFHEQVGRSFANIPLLFCKYLAKVLQFTKVEELWGCSIELRPFGFLFRRPNILGWWRKAGFLPMTRNAVHHPKVRLKLDKGDTPEKDSKRLKLLQEAYHGGVVGLELVRYNGIDTFNAKLPKMGTCKFNLTEEEKIKELMKSNMTFGQLHNLGLAVANAGVVLEARARMERVEKEEKERKEEKEKLAELNELNQAVFELQSWVAKGKAKDKNNKIKPSQCAAKTIV